MEIGKLYQIRKCSTWLLYPSREAAITAAAPSTAPDSTNASCTAAFWSRELNCKVSYISPKSFFVLLEKNGDYFKVLSSGGEVGWIIDP